MPFFRPGFFSSKFVDPTGIPVIHEIAEQSIQGGLPGQHYHLSFAAYNALVALLTSGGVYAEPVMTTTGEIVVAASGDIIMYFQQGAQAALPNAPAPAPIPDIPGPPVATPAPSPSVPATDPYWNNVVAMSFSDIPTGTLSGGGQPLTKDQYGSFIGYSGGNTVVGSNTVQVWGKNTAALVNPAVAGIGNAFESISPRQYSANAFLFGDFTFEQWMYRVAGGTDYFNFTVGTSAGTAYRMLLNPSTGVGTFEELNSGYPIQSVAVGNAFASNTPKHVCIERLSNSVVLTINGVIQATLTSTHGVTGYGGFCYAHGFGPYRVTKGVARYGAAPFTVPSTFLTA